MTEIHFIFEEGFKLFPLLSKPFREVINEHFLCLFKEIIKADPEKYFKVYLKDKFIVN